MDSENGVPTEVLEAFSEESSETALFRTRPLFDGAVATGESALTIGHILQPFDSEEANTPNETPLDNEYNDTIATNKITHSWPNPPVPR